MITNTNKNSFNSTTQLKQFNGLGLIETVCTLIIVSFGVLGLATLQIQNTATINNNINNMKSAFFAENLIQRLNDNSTLAKSITSPYILNSYTNAPTTTASTPACITSVCTPNQLAAYDMTVWLAEIKSELPNGKAKVTAELNNSSMLYTISIQWKYKSQTSQYTIVSQI